MYYYGLAAGDQHVRASLAEYWGAVSPSIMASENRL